MAQGVPGSLRLRIFLTFGTTRMVVRQPYAPATFTPGGIPGTHFQRLSRPQGTWFYRKKSPVTPPEIDPRTVRLVTLTTTPPQAPFTVITELILQLVYIFTSYTTINIIIHTIKCYKFNGKFIELVALDCVNDNINCCV